MLAETSGKRLELLLELVSAAKSIAHLGNPTNPVYADADAKGAQVAARAHGVRLLFVNASRPSEIDTAFAELVLQRADALHVSADGFLLTQVVDEVDPPVQHQGRGAATIRSFPDQVAAVSLGVG